MPGVTLPGVGGSSWTCASNWYTSSSSYCWLSCARLILLLWKKEKIAFILANRSSDLRVFSEGMSKRGRKLVRDSANLSVGHVVVLGARSQQERGWLVREGRRLAFW